LAEIPNSSVYKQGVEAVTQRKLNVVQSANGDVEAVERELDEGQIEEVIHVAEDELGLVNKMIEWKSWEPLEESPQPGQWEYFGTTTQFK